MTDDKDYDALAANIAESEGNGDLAHALHQLSQVKAKLAEVEAERDAFASNIPDAAQNLIRNAHIGRLKALHRAKALVEAGKAVVDRWDSPLWRDLRHMGESIDELRATISALEKNK